MLKDNVLESILPSLEIPAVSAKAASLRGG